MTHPRRHPLLLVVLLTLACAPGPDVPDAGDPIDAGVVDVNADAGEVDAGPVCTWPDELPEAPRAFGFPCDSDEECTGVACLPGRRGGLCTKSCAVDADCGTCGICRFVQGTATCLPVGPGAAGASCVRDWDCASFNCLGTCGEPCDVEDTRCPEGLTCLIARDFEGAGTCVPPALLGSVTEGGACPSDALCVPSLTCRFDADRGRATCLPKAERGERCFNRSDCVADLICLYDFDAERGTCEPIGTPGALCSTAEDCETGLSCDPLGFERAGLACTRACASSAECGEGQSCVAVDPFTALSLYDDRDDLSPFVFDVARGGRDGGRAAWLPGLVLEGGHTYQLELTLLQGPGRYRLFVAGAGTPPVAIAEGEPELGGQNDTRATATPRGFPVVIEGTLNDTDRTDWIEFTPATTGPVEIWVEASGPSRCIDDTRVGSRALGDACRYSAQCVTGVCDHFFRSCTTTCEEDADCGASGLSCVRAGRRRACVSNTQLGRLADGELCDADAECTGGRCVALLAIDSNTTQRRCGRPCGPDASCPEGMQCTVTDSLEGRRSCVAIGARDRGLNGDCVMDSDCADGLFCVEGRCAVSCENDDQCASIGLPGADAGSQACRPCLTDNDCDGFLCGDGRDLEQFCLWECCPPGVDCSELTDPFQCFPANASCRTPRCTAFGARRVCRVADRQLGEPCVNAGDCTTGTCTDGLCAIATCAADEECDCPDTTCAEGTCRARFERENEPNDVAEPLPFTGARLERLGTLGRTSGRRDVDRYTFTMARTFTVSFSIRPFCGTASLGFDTDLRVVDSTGTELVRGDTPNGPDSVALFLEAGTQVTVEVRAGPGTPDESGTYVLMLDTLN